MLLPIHTFLQRIGRLVLLDRAADPAANGEIQRNATHIKVYSGGAVRNLSDVGTAPSHTHASHTGVGTGDHHAQLHATAHQPAGGDAMAVDAAAGTGSLRTLGAGATQAATGNHTHAAGAVTREGGQTTETTTTSTTAVDLLSVASLNIGAAVPLFLRIVSRKTTGAATAAGGALKLNTTVVAEASSADMNLGNVTGVMDSSNQAEVADAVAHIQSIVTSYTFGAAIGFSNLHESLGGTSASALTRSVSGNRPNATLTDVVTRAISTAGITFGQDELHVYSSSIS